MKYFISDLHFFHSNIFKYEPIRKEKFKDHKNYIQSIIKKWNSKVQKDDEVYILGDLFVGYNQIKRDLELKVTQDEFAKSILYKLNGTKYLVRGNHDKKTDTWYKKVGIKDIYSYKVLDYIYNSEHFRFFLFHYPICDDYYKKQGNSWIKEIQEGVIKEKVDIVIHGHTHSNVWCQNVDNNFIHHFNVSVEQINFEPVSIENIIQEHKIIHEKQKK